VAAAVSAAVSGMIEGGIRYGCITTGEAYLFVHIPLEFQGTVYYRLAEPKSDVGAQLRKYPITFDFLHSTAVSQVLAFSLLALESTPCNQRWRNGAINSLRIDDVDLSEAGSRRIKALDNKEQKHESSGDDQASSEMQLQPRQYCTLACLLGLKRGSALDENCPNVSSHRTPESSARHPVDTENFALLILEQLAQDLDEDCEPLGKEGARGALFKLTLARYGYTFVGKGTVSVFVPDLRREGRRYQRLERIQGEAVPVYLGNIDLVLPYYLDLGVRIVHMLLMSWAGDMVDETIVPNRDKEANRTLEVWCEGVIHNDVRDANMLWNAERRRVILIDFERSTFLKLSSRKRKKDTQWDLPSK
jgi:hypothetical protein